MQIEKYKKKIFNVFLFLYLFQLFNREFIPGIDLRIPISLMAIFLVSAIDKSNLFNSFSFNIFLLFMLYSIFSVIFLFKGNIYNNSVLEITINLLILYVYQIITAITIYLYRKEINFDKVFRILFLSILFSAATSGLLYFNVLKYGKNGFKLPFMNERGYVYGSEMRNLIGQNFRIAGYSEDANYLSLNGAIFFFLTLYKFNKNNLFRKVSYIYFISLFLSLFILCISGSKTILLSVIVSLVFLLLSKYRKFITIKYVNSTFVVCIFIILSILIANNDDFDLFNISMLNRYFLWKNALKAFTMRPIFGLGLSGFRHYGANFMGNWVVHAHNTYLQVLSELGFFGISLFVIMISSNLNMIRNNIVKATTFVLLVSMFTQDLSYTSYFVLLVILLPILDQSLKENSVEKNIMILSNGLSAGGAERMVFDLSEGLSENSKYNVHLILTDPDDPNNSLDGLYDFSKINFKIYRLTNKKHAIFSNNFKLYLLTIKIKPDIIHTHQITLIYCFMTYLIGGNIVKVHTVHNDSQLEFGSRIFRQLYHLLFVVFRIHLISISHYIKETSFKEYKYLGKKYHHMIYNGRTTLKESNDLKDVYEDSFRIVMVGRLTNVKNHACAVEAMNILTNLRNVKNVELVIYGEGPEKNNLEKLIEKYNLKNNIILAGLHSNIPSILKEFDLFLMTSIHEGFPISVIEALSADLPLVLSDFGSAYELVENNGYIVKLNDYEDIAYKLNKLIDDKKLLKKFSNNSKIISKRFELNIMIEEYSMLFDELLKII